MIGEGWAAVRGYPYEVSTWGRVRNAKTGHVLKPRRAGAGYLAVNLGRGKQVLIHRLVALTFLMPPPTPDHVVCHNDGNPQNNFVWNLRWGTMKENQEDRKKHGTAAGPSRAFSDDQIEQIRHCLALGERPRHIAKRLGVDPMTIYRIEWGKTYKQ